MKPGHIIAIVAIVAVVALAITAVNYVNYQDCLKTNAAIAKSAHERGMSGWTLAWCK